MRTALVTTLKHQATELPPDIERDRAPILITRHGLPSASLIEVETCQALQQRLSILEGIARFAQAERIAQTAMWSIPPPGLSLTVIYAS